MSKWIIELDEKKPEQIVLAKRLIECKDCACWQREKPYATRGHCAMWHCGRSREDYCSEAMRKEE